MKTQQELKNYELMVASQESTTIADRVSYRANRFMFLAQTKANESDITAQQERMTTNARLAYLSQGKST